MKHGLLLVALAYFSIPFPLLAKDVEPSSEHPSYWKVIRPIFQANCQGCHQPAKKGGAYIMTSFDSMLQGGETGETAIVSGDVDSSYLVELITPSDGEAEMPKGKPPLKDAEIELIKKWIAAGAEDDTPDSAKKRFDSENPPAYSASPVITAIDCSSDGKWIAISGYHEILIHDAPKLLQGESSLAARLIGMSERIESVAFSPDGTSLAMAGGSPGRMGEVQVWKLQGNELHFSVPVTYDTCYGVSWSPDGKLVGFGCPDNTVRAVDAESGKQVLFNGAHNDWVLDTVFSVKSTNLVTVSRDRSMKLMEVATERFVDNITSITPGALKGGLNAVDRHPTKDELLLGGADGVPKIYRMFREKARKIGDDFNLIRKFPGIPGRIFSTEFSADGKFIVAGSSFNGEGHVVVFHTDDAKQVSKMENISGGIFATTFSSDAKLTLSGGFEGELYVHQTEDGKLLHKLTPFPLISPSITQTQ